jgi:hypothetical protein
LANYSCCVTVVHILDQQVFLGVEPVSIRRQPIPQKTPFVAEALQQAILSGVGAFAGGLFQ